MTIFEKFTQILSYLLGWASSITSMMTTDQLLSFCVALVVFGYVVKFFNKLRHTR